MTRPDPERGQVVRFEYLWASEAYQGFSQGEKHRPCAVVVTIQPKADKPLQAMLCGITHTEPRSPSEGIELPPEIKQSLGLDDEKSWVIVSEVNTVNWEDSRFALTPSGNWTYGSLPRELMESVREKIMSRIKTGEMDVVSRPDVDSRTGMTK